MQTEPLLSIMGIECVRELADEFDKWYMDVHLPNILQSPWCNGAVHYKKVPITKEEAPTFLTIAEFKNRAAFEAHSGTPELAYAIKVHRDAWTDNDRWTMWRGIYEPIKSWHK